MHVRSEQRRGPQRSEDTRRRTAKPALDGVRKLLTGQRMAVDQVVVVDSSCGAAALVWLSWSWHLVASAGLPVVPVPQGCNIRPRPVRLSALRMLGRVLRSWGFGATPWVTT